MRAWVTALGVWLAGCGPLTPPGEDAGAWSELATPAGLEAPFQVMVSQPGAVFALVGETTVLRSGGGRFELVTDYDDPLVLHLAATQSGAVAYTAFQLVYACEAGCTSADDFTEYTASRTPIALCGGADGLALLTTATDAGASLTTFEAGVWSAPRALNVDVPRACVRTQQGVLVTQQGGVFNAETGALEHVEVPGRDGALDPWRLAGSAGERVFVASDLGGAAVRDANGSWLAWAVSDAEISALAVESDASAWLAAGRALYRFTGSAWVSAGEGPSVLTSVAGLALQPGAVYAAGVDADGRPRIFRRSR